MEPKNPLVCIIIVNYNGAKDTVECVKSLEKNLYSNFKIIIIDNNSSDDSEKVLKELADDNTIFFIQAKENNGFSAGNNIGIEKAKELGASFFLLLNNDTIVLDSFLTSLVSAYYELGIEKAVFSGLILYEKAKDVIWYAGGKFDKYTAICKHDFINQRISDHRLERKEVSFISGCEMFCPIEVVEKVGYFDDEYFLYAEDVDYCCRLLMNGYKLFFEPSSVIFHKVSASTSKIPLINQYYSVRNRRILIHKNIPFPKKILALLISDIQTLYRLARRKLSWNCVKYGIIDYYSGKTGKCERVFSETDSFILKML